MSIVHVIPHLWSGAGGVVTRLCEAQAPHGPVTIVTAGARGDQRDWPEYRTRLRRAGVSHHTADFYHRDQATFWTSVATLARLISTVRPTVIHAHAGVPAAAAVVARQLSGHRVRLIGQMYSWGPNRPAWMNRQDLWGFGQCDRVVCSADAYWDLLVRGGVPRRRLTYLPWGLPLAQLPYRGDPPNMPAAPVVGFVGRIEPRKGQLDLVRAFSALRRRVPGAQLELVGPVADPDYAAAIRAEMRAQGTGRSVRILGAVPDAPARVRDWDLFVSLSRDEGQGLAVLEAMAVGVPVLARPVAGIVDFLTHGRTGSALRATTPTGVAAAMATALTSRDRVGLVRRARRMVERQYDWSATVAAFARLYRQRG